MPTKKSSSKTIEKPVTPKSKYFYGTGKRKTSIARVRLYEKGTGQIVINNKPFEEFIPLPIIQELILYPLTLTGSKKAFDIYVKIEGGGFNSQAEAIRHGISRALVAYNADLKSTLKPDGLLTRDARIKERKKYGLKRARRAPQFSKR
jgi:small subunit ribosomal protein S9